MQPKKLKQYLDILKEYKLKELIQTIFGLIIITLLIIFIIKEMIKW